MTQRGGTGRRELELLLIRKVWREPEFRRQIESDPKNALEQHLGHRLPAGVRIFVHLEDEATIHFSIPPRPAEEEYLPDQELEHSAGAASWAPFLSGVASGILFSLTGNNAW